MKKKLFFLFISLTSLLASADNYFTMGVNDSLRINPLHLGSTVTVPVRAHFDGRLDQWKVKVKTRKQAITVINNVTRGPGMDVPYQDFQGNDSVYHAALTCLRIVNDSVINEMTSSITDVTGYWDYDGSGHYAPYGNVKWEAGDYDCMFNMRISIDATFRSDTITFDYELQSSGDARGGIIPSYSAIRRVFVYVGYMLGDVDGNEVFGMGDLTALIDYLVYNEGLDEFKMAAADLNGDGIVGMDDLTLMINWLTS